MNLRSTFISVCWFGLRKQAENGQFVNQTVIEKINKENYAGRNSDGQWPMWIERQWMKLLWIWKSATKLWLRRKTWRGNAKERSWVETPDPAWRKSTSTFSLNIRHSFKRSYDDGQVYRTRAYLYGFVYPVHLRNHHPLVRDGGGKNPSRGRLCREWATIQEIYMLVYYNYVFNTSQHDSVFDLRRPYDMVAMLRQETRAASLDTLKQVCLWTLFPFLEFLWSLHIYDMTTSFDFSCRSY